MRIKLKSRFACEAAFLFYHGGIMQNENVLAVIGADAPISAIEGLKREGFCVITLARDERLPSPVASHADMILFREDDRIFISAAYAEKCPDIIEYSKEYGYSAVLCNCVPKSKYPDDILFNIATVGNNVFADLKHIDATVKAYLECKGYFFNSVNQGYAKCSTVIVANNEIITADKGIAKKATLCGIDVLIIKNSQDAVALRGYNYGFLGGACGLFNNDLYFCGNITKHPEYVSISDFCRMHGVRLTSLSDEPLYDVGGIFFFERLT